MRGLIKSPATNNEWTAITANVLSVDITLPKVFVPAAAAANSK